MTMQRSITCFIALAGLLALWSPLRSAEVNDRTWLNDPGGIVHEKGDELWLVARSSEPCLDPAEATESARRAAVNTLTPVVRSRLWRSGHESLPDSQISHALDLQLLAPGVIADRNIEQQARPYGQLWQASILVRVPVRQIDSLAASLGSRAERTHRAHLAQVVGVVILVIATYILYHLLNLLTKGYFARALRFVAVLVIVGGALLFWVVLVP